MLGVLLRTFDRLALCNLKCKEQGAVRAESSSAQVNSTIESECEDEF